MTSRNFEAKISIVYELGLRSRQYTDPVCELNEQYYLVNYVCILSVV